MPPATGEGPLHAPPASGLPPRAPTIGVAGLLMQRVSDASAPAPGGACTCTVTVLEALMHGGGTLIVYVYTPAAIAAGSNMPPATGEGPLHAPPASGVPPSCAKSATGASLAHRVMLPGRPASGAATTATLSAALAAGQGAAPATV